MAPEQPAKLVALLLAAGSGRRFGGRKLLAHLGNQTLARHTANAARRAGLPLLAVVPPDDPELVREIGAACVATPADARPSLSHSIRTGLDALDADWTGALILLADMPRVRPSTLRVLAAALQHPDDIVLPCTNGRRGNPVGWGRTHWPMLMRLEGDRGGSQLLDGLSGYIKRVEVDDPGIFEDVDTLADLRRLSGE